MFTVAQVADKLGVTTQYIYHKINNQMKEELASEVQEVANGKRSVRMITERGVELISNTLEKVVDNNLHDINKQLLELLQDNVDMLQEQLLAKDKQLDVKDLQIKELNLRLQELTKLNENSQILLRDKKENQAIAIEENKGFLAKWLGKTK